MKKEQFWKALKSGQFASMIGESSKGQVILSAQEVYNVMKPLFAEADDVERMYCIFVNTKNRLIAIEKIADGTISHSVIYPREIIKRILALKAAGVVFVHNHPSGDTEPSREDKNITMKLATVLSSMDVDLLDHVIVGDNYHSMADSGYIASMNTRMRDLVLA